MSKLRKSASFRSRIPIRHCPPIQKRYCSPHLDIGGGEFDESYFAEQNFPLRTNNSFAFESCPRNVRHPHLQIHQTDSDYSHCANDNRSSSYSSSDESCESEAQHQKFVQQCSKLPPERLMYISNDAISLDELLDTLSCGSSFSSPPSPVQYQNAELIRNASYESLDKFNAVLESFALTDNLTKVGHSLRLSASDTKIQRCSVTQSNEKPKRIAIRNNFLNAPSTMMSSEEAPNANFASSTKDSYTEKQNQLSDWYYIKSKNSNAERPGYSGKRNEVIDVETTSNSLAKANLDHTSLLAVRGSKQITASIQAQSLPRPATNTAISAQKKPLKWNGFDDPTAKSNNIMSAEDVYIQPNDAITSAQGPQPKYSSNRSLPRESGYAKLLSPPYHCPPEYNTYQNYSVEQHSRKQQQSTSYITPETSVLSKVNVKSLKEQYQQQQKSLFVGSAKYANTRTASPVETGRKNQHQVELKLKHWENIGNNGIQANQHKINEEHAAMSHGQQQQEQLNLRLQTNRYCDNEGDAIFTSNSNASGGMQKQSQIGSNALHKNHESLRTSHQQQQGGSLELQKSDTGHHLHLSAAPRRYVLPLAATPRPALRLKLLQKRPDETSCSSFEQLNLVDTSPEAVDCSASHAISQKHATNSMNRTEFAGDRGEVGHNEDEAETAQNTSKTHKYYPTCTTSEMEKYGNDGDAALRQPQHLLSLDSKYKCTKPPITEESGYGILPLQPADHSSGFQGVAKTAPRRPQHPKTSAQGQAQKLQVQMQLQQNPLTRQLFGVIQPEVYQPKAPLYRNDCELSGSYASLECPSPPGPPICLPESQKDPQARLNNYLRNLYQELYFKEPVIPPWAIPVAPGALCSARLEPDLRLNSNSHGYSDSLTVDQVLVSLQTKEGNFLDAPRRCLIECPTWASRSSLCLRILYAWAKEPPWPSKGTPVALTLFIPLCELKRSLAHYVEKELLPKGHLNPFACGAGGFNAAWNSLEALGPKLLIILDGYANQKFGNSATYGVVTPKKAKSGSFIGGGATKHHYPSDVHDLLDGKLFPDARIIITTYATSCMELMPLVQRHIIYDGLTWGRSASILEGGQWSGPSRLLDTIRESVHLRKAVRTPLGCLAVAAIYETSNGDLPVEELDVVESILNCAAPDASSAIVSELGRLALFCLKMKRTCITMAEIRMYCSAPDSIMGCLEKNILYGKTSKKKMEYVFNPICPSMMEFLAANYIASLASRPGLLGAEITGMAIGDELDLELLKVLKFAMALLGEQAHILLSRLTPLWLTPQIVFTLALAGGHNESNLAALCDILGISKHPPISPLETKPLWVQVRSVPTDLMGWGMALKSPTCTLKNLEVIYQLEKQNLAESRKAIDIFLDSIVLNESVSTLRLSSLIETDVKDSEITYLANCISKLILKPRLENFEIVLTLIEEDPPMLKLQSVVAALCRTIPRQTKLSSILLDLGLSTSQLVQLCSALEKCPNITRLSLPHLRCERGAISAISSLLSARPLSFLSLPSCWGARDDPPSSSGVSMGSGSGSSTGTSCLIKQGSLTGVPSPRSYAPGIFSSLPRGVFVPQSSLGRSATLPRQPLEQTVEKRSCDSVVSKIWYPTPACDGGPHNSGTLHDLFSAVRDSYSKLHGLDLSKAQLSLEDSMCLGESVRLSNTLHTLKLEGSSRISEILPSILGASESPCLQMLSIGSQRLNLEDSVVVMCARALTSCTTLRLLSLDGWCFRVEHIQTLSILRAFLSLTSIRELSLANCRLQTPLIKTDTKIAHVFECRSVVVLKLAGAYVTLADLTVIRGPQLLPYIGGFPCLRELDLSAQARSGVESTHSSPLILDDKCAVQFFHGLHSNFGLLNTLKICNWVIHFDELNRTLKSIAKALRNSPISHLKLDGISVLDRPRKQRSEAAFVHCFITSLPHLRWMGISLAGKKEEQISAIGNAVLDLKGTEIEIKLSESTIEQAKLMAQAISVDGKFDIKVSTFGTSSGILIHAVKCGVKSLTRTKLKEKDQYF